MNDMEFASIVVGLLLLGLPLGCAMRTHSVGDVQIQNTFTRVAEEDKLALLNARAALLKSSGTREQSGRVREFNQTYDMLLQKYPHLVGYEILPFDAMGELLLPQANVREHVKYAVILDTGNHPSLFLPFVLQIEHVSTWDMLRLPF